MLFSAANEEFLKIDYVVQKNIGEFLFYINFLQRKNELDAAKIRKNNKS